MLHYSAKTDTAAPLSTLTDLPSDELVVFIHLSRLFDKSLPSLWSIERVTLLRRRVTLDTTFQIGMLPPKRLSYFTGPFD